MTVTSFKRDLARSSLQMLDKQLMARPISYLRQASQAKPSQAKPMNQQCDEVGAGGLPAHKRCCTTHGLEAKNSFLNSCVQSNTTSVSFVNVWEAAK